MLVLLLHDFVVDVVTEGRTVSGTPACGCLVGPRGNENVISVVSVTDVGLSAKLEGPEGRLRPTILRLLHLKFIYINESRRLTFVILSS